MKKLCAEILLAAVLSSVLYGADTNSEWWPTWRAPAMMGVSPDGDPPVKWSESENIKWKVALTGDASNSSPVIWENKMFFQTAVETETKGEAGAEAQPTEDSGGRGGRARGKKPTNIYKFNVVCLDRKTGKQMWQETVCEALPHEGHHGDHGFASFSPVTDGKLIWASFGSRGVYCLDMDGNLKWQYPMPKMTMRGGFGEGSSPALAGDVLLVLADQEENSFIVALNKQTGEEVWKKDRDERTAWTTPVVVEYEGKTQAVVNGHQRIRSYDPKTGDIVWECDGGTENIIPSPVVGHGMVFCTSGFRGSSLKAIKLGRTGDLTGTDAVAWQVTQATPYVPSPLLYDKKVYVFSVNNAILSCYNAETGTAYYEKEKLEEMKGIYASPVAASDRLYFVGRNGVTYVLKNSEKLEVLAVNALDDSIDCSPAIVGREMYLKGKKNLYCIAAPE